MGLCSNAGIENEKYVRMTTLSKVSTSIIDSHGGLLCYGIENEGVTNRLHV